MYLIDKHGHRLVRVYVRDGSGGSDAWLSLPYVFCPTCERLFPDKEIFGWKVFVKKDFTKQWLRAKIKKLRWRF